MNKWEFGDSDHFNRRLLLFMRDQAKRPFLAIKQVKPGVWVLTTSKQSWVVKEFSSLEKLMVQIKLTEELRKYNFFQTYTIEPKPFLFEDRVFGLISYIKPGIGTNFDYQTRPQIEHALQLLSKFHKTTRKFVSSFESQIPKFQQIEKWKRRLMEFNETIQVFANEQSYPYLKNYAKLGQWALLKMSADRNFYTDEPLCIIHGDVASHNFIIREDGKLFLIDYDLVSIAPPQIDLLQLSNRILPILNWNEQLLFTFSSLSKYKNVRPFLSALVYPSDIFREWIHYSKSSLQEQKRKWPYLEQVTFQQYQKRISFYKRIMKKINVLEDNK